MHTGKDFAIFQDKKDLLWGQQWKKRLDSTLLNVTFLIPIITPSYFYSTPCREEFNTFLLRERQLGEDRLILPIYYLDADPMTDANTVNADEIARILASRNWADWRQLRFKEIGTYEVDSAIAEMARTIKAAMKELEGIIAASKVATSHIAPILPIPEISQNIIDSFTPDAQVIRDGGYSRDRHRQISKDTYYIYTTEFDEEIEAKDLSDTDELKQLSSYFMRQVRKRKNDYKSDIAEFQKIIAAKFFGKEIAVTLLLDNSGSLRGTRILEIATWAFIVSEMLDAALIANEVLGFTTRAWKGGQSREQWLQDGKPSNPGRLNDLRHLIYKKFDHATPDASAGFALMLREGLLKENIDGEAVLWAFQRLTSRSIKEKILVVVSDGAPVDDSTLNQNPTDFLDKNLVSCIRWVEKQDNTKIFGVGVDFDNSRYYTNNISSKEGKELGKNLFFALTSMV